MGEWGRNDDDEERSDDESENKLLAIVHAILTLRSQFAYINPIRDPWVKVRDIGFLERFAEKADQFLYKYESGLNPQEFDSEYSMCTCKFIEENREYLETCDDDEFSDWCFKEVGDGARDPKPGPHAGKSYGFAAGIFNGKFKFHDQGWYIPSQMWGGSVQDDCYIKE